MFFKQLKNIKYFKQILLLESYELNFLWYIIYIFNVPMYI